MAVRLDKPWRALTAENVEAVGGHLGVYQLADAATRILYIGVAGEPRPPSPGLGRPVTPRPVTPLAAACVVG